MTWHCFEEKAVYLYYAAMHVTCTHQTPRYKGWYLQEPSNFWAEGGEGKWKITDHFQDDHFHFDLKLGSEPGDQVGSFCL